MKRPLPTGDVGSARKARKSELVFGFVAPVGTNFALFQNRLERCLAPYGYQTKVVRLSKLIGTFEVTAGPKIEDVVATGPRRGA